MPLLLNSPLIRTDKDPSLPDYVVVRHSNRAKKLALRLDPQERIFTLVIPKRVSLKRARQFALENERWMRHKLAELPSFIPLTHGTTLPILGQEKTIYINYDIGLKRTRIEFKNNEIIISTNQENPTPRLVRFLKKTAQEKFSVIAHEKAAKIESAIHAIQIRDTKSRWGSCTEDGRICLSWRLIFAPWSAMDYVIAHEVAHLRHLDHSPNFWELCEALSESYKEGKNWMRQHSAQLMRYR